MELRGLVQQAPSALCVEWLNGGGYRAGVRKVSMDEPAYAARTHQVEVLHTVRVQPA